MSTNPAPDLATAPVLRFARFDSLGRLLEWVCFAAGSRTPMRNSTFERATWLRSALREVKYMADPKPVRSAEGRVPRQKERMEEGFWEV